MLIRVFTKYYKIVKYVLHENFFYGKFNLTILKCTNYDKKKLDVLKYWSKVNNYTGYEPMDALEKNS